MRYFLYLSDADLGYAEHSMMPATAAAYELSGTTPCFQACRHAAARRKDTL
jgi:hypothetical protein